MTIDYVDGLLKVLREHGVAKFKNDTIEVEFGPRAFLRDPMVDISNEPEAKEKKTPDEVTEDDLFYSSGG